MLIFMISQETPPEVIFVVFNFMADYICSEPKDGACDVDYVIYHMVATYVAQ